MGKTSEKADRPKTAVEYIHSLGRFSGAPGLHRIQALCAALGNPQNELRFVHLAGTNGKGSTACMIASMMQAAGYRVGLYTSPFLIRFHERIRVNHTMISNDDLERLTEKVSAACRIISLPEGETIGAFEFTTALAFLYYVEQKCDIVVLETGLGGRYDATNIITSPEVCVITSVSLDHTEVLGDTIAQIAAEKAAILKPDALVVTALDQELETLTAIRTACRTTGAALIEFPYRYDDLHSPFYELLRCDKNGAAFLYQEQGYTLSMLGFHQIKNALTALYAIEALRRRGWNIPIAAAVHGLAKARIPGRLERMRENPLILLDGAHNINGIQALCRFIDNYLKMQRLHIIMGMMRDKKYAVCIREAASRADVFYACAPEEPERALPAQSVAAVAESVCKQVYDCSGTEQALQMAIQAADAADCILICGSLHLVGEAEKILRTRQKLAE